MSLQCAKPRRRARRPNRVRAKTPEAGRSPRTVREPEPPSLLCFCLLPVCLITSLFCSCSILTQRLLASLMLSLLHLNFMLINTTLVPRRLPMTAWEKNLVNRLLTPTYSYLARSKSAGCQSGEEGTPHFPDSKNI